MTILDWELLPGQTPFDRSHLKKKEITTLAALNLAEEENIRKVHVRYLAGKPSKRLAPFDYAWMLRLHLQMFGDIWSFAGELRREKLNLGVPWMQIQGQLFSLVDDLWYWCNESQMPFIEQATRLHFQGVRIHPFLNGNGRWARMLANIWLRRHGEPIVAWPEKTIGTSSEIRSEYITSLRAADRGEFSSLFEMHKRYQAAMA